MSDKDNDLKYIKKKRYERENTKNSSNEKLGSIIIQKEEEKKNNKYDDQEKLPTYKRNLVIFSLIFLVFLTLILRQTTGIGTENDSITIKKPKNIKISLDYNMVDKEHGQKIKIEVYPKGSDTKDLKWYITDENVLEVKNNMVYGKDKGKAKISLANNTVKSNMLEVESVKFINGINIQNSIKTLPIKSEYKYEVKCEPEDGANKDITIESTDPSIISVKDPKNLIIYAEKKGETTIVFKDNFGNKLKEEVVKVEWDRITDITIDTNEYIMGKGQKYIVSAKLSPKNATFKDLIWKSSNPSIASIDENNIITANGIGTCEIAAMSNDYKISSKMKLTVVEDAIHSNKKYVSGIYDIYSGPSKLHNVIGKTDTLSDVEILGEINGYYKIRDKKGNPGFVKNDVGYFFDNLPKMINGIEYVSSEKYGYQTAGELLSTYMVLKYIGLENITIDDMIKMIETGEEIHIINEDGKEKRVGSNPFDVYVGNVNKSKYDGKYGTYAKQIVKSINRIRKGTAEDVSGTSEEGILSYIDKNIPVVIWSNSENNKFIEDGIEWYTKDNQIIKEKKNFDVVVLIGYNDNYVIINDPIKGANIILKRKDFFENNNRIYRQAFILNK